MQILPKNWRFVPIICRKFYNFFCWLYRKSLLFEIFLQIGEITGRWEINTYTFFVKIIQLDTFVYTISVELSYIVKHMCSTVEWPSYRLFFKSCKIHNLDSRFPNGWFRLNRFTSVFSLFYVDNSLRVSPCIGAVYRIIHTDCSHVFSSFQRNAHWILCRVNNGGLFVRCANTCVHSLYTTCGVYWETHARKSETQNGMDCWNIWNRKLRFIHMYGSK